MRLVSGFPFGTGIASRMSFVPSPTIIHPRWVDIAGFPLLEAVSTPNEPIHDRRRRGAGMDFYGIREYRSGDSLRHVHWRSVARAGRLLVREYEDQPASRLGILIDTFSTVGMEPETAFEDAVACAASLVVYALQVGHPVQLFGDSARGTLHLFEPGRNDALDWLAGIEADGRRGMTAVAQELAGEIRPRSTNVLIFPSTHRSAEDALRAISVLQSYGTRVMAIVISAASYDDGAASYDDGAASGCMTIEQEAAFANDLLATRAMAYRVYKGRDLSECLSEPYA